MKQRPVYDVAIIGSGAGGGMAAYQLTKAGARVVLLEAFSDHLQHDLVGNQLATCHVALRLETEFGTRLHRSTQHVPRRYVGDDVVVGEAHALRSLACALFPENDEPRSGQHLVEKALVVAHRQLAVDLLHRF